MTALEADPGIALDLPATVEPMGRIAFLSDVPPQGQGPLRVRIGDAPAGLFRVGEEVVAWRDVCPHEAASVCRGPVTGTRLQSAVYAYEYGRHQEILHCPWHGWEFDLRSGEHLAEGSGAKLRRHPIEVRGGEIFDASGGGAILDLPLRVAAVREIGRCLEIDLEGGGHLPAWQPGAHLEITLPSGRVRQYSLCGDDRDRARYRIAVLREEPGRGGSAELHGVARAGGTLRATRIRNRFPLRYAASYLFLGAGIGITPILAMARAAARRHADSRAVYIGRDLRSMPLREEVAALPGARVVETSREGRPDLVALLRERPDGTAVYCCGPDAFVDAVRRAADEDGRGLAVHAERFAPATGPVPTTEPEAFEAVLAGSGRVIAVARDESLLQALRSAGIARPSSCESGWCGSCELPVRSGTIVHADTVLDEEERKAGEVMMPCVSRGRGRVVIEV